MAKGGYQSRGEPLFPREFPNAPPPGYIGGLLSEQPVLLRRPNLVAFLTKVRAYPAGVLFQVAIEEREAEVLERVMDWDEDVQVAVVVEGSQDHPEVSQLSSEASSGEEGASWLAEYWVPHAPGDGQFVFQVTIGDLVGSTSLPGALLQSAATSAVDSSSTNAEVDGVGAGTVRSGQGIPDMPFPAVPSAGKYGSCQFRNE